MNPKEDQSRVSGDDRTCGTGTCLCLNKNPEGELFFPQTTLLRDAILAKEMTVAVSRT
jgi:hypothetical protein